MPLRDDVLQPIAGANPAGANLRDDPVWAKIKEARREEDDAPQGDWVRARKVADWPQVVKLAGDAIATKTKDLELAAWLTEALARQEGLAGLRAGLGLIGELLQRFWEHVYPLIEDGNDVGLRAKHVGWLSSRLPAAVRGTGLNKAGHDFFKYKESRALGYEADAAADEKKAAARQAALADGKLAPEEFDKALAATPKAWYKELVANADACVAAVRALDALAEQKFADDAPGFDPLLKALEDVGDVARQLLTKKLETDPDPPGASGETSMGSAGGTGAVSGTGALSPEPTSVEDAAARVAGAARFLRRANPRSPAPYLMLRGFRWGELRSAPELDPKLLAAPPTSVRTHLKSLLLDARWPELLDAGEDLLATPHGRGWLDLQRYELTACEQLGADFEAVTVALRVALVGLLRDLPQLPDLTLMDDTPTANAETRSWLQSTGIVAAAAEAAAEGAARPGPELRTHGGGGGGWTNERAMDEVRAGRPQKGIELLMRQADREKSSRARFVARSQAASIMVDAGLETVAMPILKELLDQIEAHKLEEWEAGDLVARPLGLMFRCFQKVGGDAEAQDNLYRRICRLDPLQAMNFAGGNAGGSGDGTSGA